MAAAAGQALRVAVVGAGSISREFALYHFGQHTDTVVAAIVDLQAERAAALAAEVGSKQAGAEVAVPEGGRRYQATVTETKGEPVFSASALGPDVLKLADVVFVGTTPSSHAALTLQALEA